MQELLKNKKFLMHHLFKDLKNNPDISRSTTPNTSNLHDALATFQPYTGFEESDAMGSDGLGTISINQEFDDEYGIRMPNSHLLSDMSLNEEYDSAMRLNTLRSEDRVSTFEYDSRPITRRQVIFK